MSTRLWSCAAAGGLSAAVLAYAFSGEANDAAPALAAPAPAPAAPQRAWFAVVPAPMATGGAPQLSAGGDLVVDKGLLDMLNVYLVAQAKSGGPARLMDALRSQLSGHALDQARQIAERYQRYIKEHDVLLAAQNFQVSAATPDLSRLRVWVELRAHLRESVLGTDVAQAWYGEEDVKLHQMLRELEQGGSAVAPPRDESDPRSAVNDSIRRNETLQHVQQLRDTLQSALRSFT